MPTCCIRQKARNNVVNVVSAVISCFGERRPLMLIKKSRTSTSFSGYHHPNTDGTMIRR